MSALKPLVLMMAGGTGGHVYPALAVATELLARGYRVEWVGSAKGLENRVVPAANIPLHTLSVRGLRGKGLLDKALGAFSLLLASVQALWLVIRRAPGCVIGMGGYASGPAGVAAWLLRKPVLIHEQNAIAGTTNRMLAPMASAVAAGFPGAFPSDINNTVVGNPVRAQLLQARSEDSYRYTVGRPIRLLVLGGSLGAQAINEAIPQMLAALESAAQPGVEIWHQTGTAHIDHVLKLYGNKVSPVVRVVPFIEEMEEAYLWADLVVCRAGALTIAELAVVGRPAILVPLPGAIDDHQSANARALTETGAAILLPQHELNGGSLAELVGGLVQYPEKLRNMARASFNAAKPDAAQRVSDMCEELLHA